MKIVIVGGGFGGLYAAQALRRVANVQITLVDKRNFHLFQPLLYQVATGSLSPGEIAAPLRSVLKDQQNTQVLMAEVTGIDAAAKKLELDGGAEHLDYDALIVATGSRTSYFGNDQWAEEAPGLKTVEDATRIRHKILRAFEAAEKEDDPELRRAYLTFLIVGGGPTGVELAGAIAEIANDTLRHDFRSIRPEESRILVLDGGPRVLGAFPEELSEKAERSLLRMGVRTRNGVRVTGVDADGVLLQSGERVAAKTVIWAAGVAASGFGKVLSEATKCELDRGGRVIVGPDLTVPGYPEIFVIGDAAAAKDKAGNPLPGVAPVAMQQGRYAAHQVVADPALPRPPFVYHNKGNLAVIGRASAVADFGWLKVSGFLAWLLWLFIHLMYVVEFENRLLVFIKWGIQYFTFNRGARLITGEPAREKDTPVSG
ncbi:MAG: NAD(P)/FAD-dependent oxidoreductase [Acidobacteria bacterium]|nr:NAD(P)/FAD-dependent oxidoreductase [Acidobacteriota bacterium]